MYVVDGLSVCLYVCMYGWNVVYGLYTMYDLYTVYDLYTTHSLYIRLIYNVHIPPYSIRCPYNHQDEKSDQVWSCHEKSLLTLSKKRSKAKQS